MVPLGPMCVSRPRSMCVIVHPTVSLVQQGIAPMCKCMCVYIIIIKIVIQKMAAVAWTSVTGLRLPNLCGWYTPKLIQKGWRISVSRSVVAMVGAEVSLQTIYDAIERNNWWTDDKFWHKNWVNLSWSWIKDKVDEAENQSCSSNHCALNIPEQSEGKDMMAFLNQLILQLLGKENFSAVPITSLLWEHESTSTSICADQLTPTVRHCQKNTSCCWYPVLFALSLHANSDCRRKAKVLPNCHRCFSDTSFSDAISSSRWQLCEWLIPLMLAANVRSLAANVLSDLSTQPIIAESLLFTVLLLA